MPFYSSEKHIFNEKAQCKVCITVNVYTFRDIQERRKRRLHRTSVMKNSFNKNSQIDQTKKEVTHEIVPLCNLENAQEQNLNHHPIKIIIRWLSDLLGGKDGKHMYGAQMHCQNNRNFHEILA